MPPHVGWSHLEQRFKMTLTNLIAAASKVLEAGGYQQIRKRFTQWNTTSTRLFEDTYNVVGVAVFSTSAELLRSWADLQASLVEVISQNVGRAESKAWDGYLVLLTTGIAPSTDPEIEELRRDTTRLRKLVATGDDLSSSGDVERVLRSLLPLKLTPGLVGQGTALDMLGEILEEHGISRETTAALVKSYVEQEPVMDALNNRWAAE
jgi:hypothetical protein